MIGWNVSSTEICIDPVVGVSECLSVLDLQEVSNKATGQEIARGKTGIVCFDYTKRKVAAVPASLQAKLQIEP